MSPKVEILPCANSFTNILDTLHSNPNTQRFNFNGLGGGAGGIYPQQGLIPHGLPQGGYPQGVGGYPSTFNNGAHGPVRGQYQPNIYGNGFGIGGQYPGVIGGGQYPGGLGPIAGNFNPNHGINSGKVPAVLVGPGVTL